MKSPADFGERVLAELRERPLGSLTKRELELVLIRAAIDSAIVKPKPVELAQTFRLTLAKSHGYLTDLALRLPPVTDIEGARLIAGELRAAEVTQDGSHLAIPINDAGLRLWLERRLSSSQLQQGESFRRELVKLTPIGLCKLLDAAQGLRKPYLALDELAEHFGREEWFLDARSRWKPATPWQDALKSVAIDSVASVISAAVSGVVGPIIGTASR